ncbi:MAG: hypothetical protein CL787_03210 [Chloroflexi bacterium]|nr:hypothetical protein [Chloroflexota bacterium]
MEIDKNVDSFLSETRVAVLGTTGSDGYPHMVPIWFKWEDGEAYMFTSQNSTKWKNILKSPAASLCIDHREAPYAAVTIYGKIIASEEPFYENIRSMAIRYLGENKGETFADSYKDNPPEYIGFKLIPEKIHWNLKMVE